MKRLEKLQAAEDLMNEFSQPQLESLRQIASNLKAEKPSEEVLRVNDKIHYEETKACVNTLNIPQLDSLKEYYIQMNKITMFSNFDNYIELIDNRIETLKTNNYDRAKEKRA